VPPPKRFPRPVAAARNAAQRLYDTLAGVEQLKGDLAHLSGEVAALRERIEAGDSQARTERLAISAAQERDHADTRRLFQMLRDDEPANRQRLWRVRATSEYARAFEEPEPLVSFCVATYTSTKTLLERTLPSILGQTYERIEVVIVGDAAAPEVERAVKSVGDPRLRYANMTLRGPYPDAQEQLWHVAGGPPSNEAMRLARGRWIASIDDDDESTPDRVEVLLREARERELEFCYGRFEWYLPDGGMTLVGAFPPEYAKIGLQASLMHTDMRFVCAELSDALFDEPGDWSRIRRMMRLGVRMGMVDQVVARIYPHAFWPDRES
jgi:hypothetical protein